MPSLDSEIETLEREQKELSDKLKELRRQKALEENRVVCFVHKFSLSSNTVRIRLSKYRFDVVNYLQYQCERTYSESTGNIIPIQNLPKFLEYWIKDETVVVTWEEESRVLYDQWLTRPDVFVDLDPKRPYVLIQLGAKVSTRDIYLKSYISSFERDESKGYRFSIAELYQFPEAMLKAYPGLKIEYSDLAKETLFNQINKRKVVAELANATDAPDIRNPFINGFDLKPHQRVAVKFVEMTGDLYKRAIIAYDMGTGKSAIAIALAERHTEWKKVLIICPASLKTNWKREIKKFSGKDSFMLSGVEPDSLSIDHLLDPTIKYYIINYDIIGRSIGPEDEKVMKWVEVINLIGFDFIVTDEAHYIKNMDSNRSKGVRALKYKSTIPMSGTPLVNRPLELYPNLSIIDPISFNSPTAFSYQFTNNDGTARNVKKLHEMMSSYMIRRTRKDVYGDKIHIERIPFTKELSSNARRVYQQILNGVYESLRKPDYKTNVTSIFAELIRCKQTCSADNINTTAELAIDAYEETEKKVLIFSQFKESQYGLQQIIGSSSVVVNGDVVDDQRYTLMDKFQDPKSDVKYWITNILEGLTLTQAHTVIFNDIWWTPKDHSQAEGRCFGRDNDPHGGNSYWLENENTIDQFLNDLLMKKTAVFNEVIDGVRNSQEEQRSIMSQLIEHLREGL